MARLTVVGQGCIGPRRWPRTRAPGWRGHRPYEAGEEDQERQHGRPHAAVGHPPRVTRTLPGARPAENPARPTRISPSVTASGACPGGACATAPWHVDPPDPSLGSVGGCGGGGTGSGSGGEGMGPGTGSGGLGAGPGVGGAGSGCGPGGPGGGVVTRPPRLTRSPECHQASLMVRRIRSGSMSSDPIE